MRDAHGGSGNKLLTYAAIRQTNDLIQKLLIELKKLTRETIILFHSDNGGTLNGCNYPYKGWKTQLTEGGTLSPAFLYSTHSRQSIRRSDAMIHITDWFPTLLQLSGLEIPTGLSLDGVNQKHIFEKPNAESGRDRFIYSIMEKITYLSFTVKPNWRSGFAVRIGKWKFYNYRHDVGIRKCAVGFRNEQLYNNLRKEYDNGHSYEQYLRDVQQMDYWRVLRGGRQQLEQFGKLHSITLCFIT